MSPRKVTVSKKFAFASFLTTLSFTALAQAGGLAPVVDGPTSSSDYGIELACTDIGGPQVVLDRARDYLESKGIKAQWLQAATRPGDKTTVLRLDPAVALDSTLGISREPKFGVSADLVDLLDPRRQPRQVPTVSQKEILLAMLHPGRLTRFEGVNCGLEALKDDVGVRQNTVAWAQTLEYGWPDGGPASWNEKYWVKGTPVEGANLHEALTDMLINSGDYSIGCYTAAKMVIAGSFLDYYTRVKKSPSQSEAVKQALLQGDGEPLVGVEPGNTWYFEPGYDPKEAEQIPGKVLRVLNNVAPGSFVPGDWFYLLNPDAVSYQKTGYEGSNAIYLGMDRFSDYYNDHEHSFNYKQKVNEVYQWRHGVFSRTKDADKVRPLSEADYLNLSQTPEQGGLLPSMRVVPKPF